VKQPIWMRKEIVRLIHDDQIDSFGGSFGIRDEGLLGASLARPQHLFADGQPSIFELAAAYGFGLTKNHPFIDGNKRTAFHTMAVFLELNGYQFKGTELEVVLIMERLAEDLETQETLAQWLEENSKELE